MSMMLVTVATSVAMLQIADYAGFRQCRQKDGHCIWDVICGCCGCSASAQRIGTTLRSLV